MRPLEANDPMHTSKQGVRGAGALTSLLLGLLLTLLVPGPAGAQLVTVPPGLAPGAGYRLVFVTSAVRNGSSANVSDYNTFVSNAANAVPALAALGTSWKAVAETATVTAQDNTGTNPLIVGGNPTNRGVPFFRLDGAHVADDNLYFWNMIFPLAPISITELGGPAPISVRAPDGSTQPWVWTGFTPGPSKLGSSTPVAAWANAVVANSWIGVAISPSANGHALYAVSGILHAPQPVPTLPVVALSALLANLALGVFHLGGERRVTRSSSHGQARRPPP